MPEPISLDNLNLYSLFPSGTSRVDCVNAIKTFMLSLKHFNQLENGLVVGTGSNYATLTMNFDELGIYVPIVLTIDQYNRTVVTHGNTILMTGQNVSYVDCNIYSLETQNSSMWWLDQLNYTQQGVQYGSLKYLLTRVLNRNTNQYDMVLITANDYLAYIHYGGHIMVDINTCTSLSNNKSTKYTIKPFSYGNYIFDELFLIYSGSEIQYTDEVVKFNDTVYFRVHKNLYVKT